MAKVILKKRRAMPFVYRHPWLFSGAIARIEGECSSGDVVDVLGGRGDFIGRGLFCKNSQITVRLLSWNKAEAVDDDFFRRRIDEAVALRERVVPLTEGQTARRLVFSEGDGLPGLIVDQYGDWLVTQFLSFGLDQRRELILDALEDALHPQGTYDRSDAAVRGKEGLEQHTGTLRGEDPPERLTIHDGGVIFEIDIRTGQKTGHYLDQRDNHAAAARLATGRRVLDAFCYAGGFGIAAALAGANEVVCVDSSGPSLDLAQRNAELNGCDNIAFERSKVAPFLRAQPERSFGLVVLDPPGFAKSSYDVDGALSSYTDLYACSMRLLEPGGVLVACCCSQHIAPQQILRALNAAGVNSDRSVRVLEMHGQPADHPIAANCPETAYLKSFVCAIGG
jgi:23S rRNA (cytosine1962-C5)-methyltransferase